MKKAIFCFMVAFLILLWGCANNPSSDIEETENTTDADSSTETYASDLGAINDATNNRHLELTDEQKEFINAMLQRENESTTAEVTEATKPDISALLASVQKGMTYAEVVAILGESGPDIGSGLCMYEWTLPDGSVWRGSFQQQGDDNIPPEDWVLFNFDLVK